MLVKSEPAAYSIKTSYHIFAGFGFSALMVIIGIIISLAMGTTLEWQTPQTWIGALLLNMLVALLYEPLPEELIFRIINTRNDAYRRHQQKKKYLN